MYTGGTAVLQIAQGGFISQQVRKTVGKGEGNGFEALHTTRRFRADPAQLHRARKEACQPGVNFIGRDAGGKMIAPDFGRRVYRGEIAKARDRAGTVWCGKV
ncbi:hypothetical protein D3C85_1283350 [compost metagenome]